jgi:hypothetical protein
MAPFVANLRGKAGAMHSIGVTSPSRLTLSLNVDGTPTNNINNAKRRPHPMRKLGWIRRSREDGFERCATKKKKKLKVVGPTVEARKTKTLAEIDDSEQQ